MPPAARPKTATAPTPAKRIQVRRSGVHGKGVYAVAPIAADEIIIEYTGERISWDEAMDRHPHDPDQPNHTFYFHIDDGRVIDALHGGNSSRWINHACDPNCEADEADGRVFIKALRDLAPGEELFYDYGLVIDERYTPKLKKEFACRCGSPDCRGTMLAPKQRKARAKALNR
ncbi:SET domain-containing protein-lysine N-methyltransferase [soil metagenome]